MFLFFFKLNYFKQQSLYIMDSNYVAERIKSIQSTEQKLVEFLEGFSKLLESTHDAHANINHSNNDDDDDHDDTDKEQEIKDIIDKCYTDISYASVHLRRELKLLDVKLPLPPNLSKKASDANNEKLKQLLD